ncbi:MAG: hypothetical protein WBC93_13940 [Sulfitobacter sp.]
MAYLSEKFFVRIVALTIVIGLLYRLFPIVTGQPNLSQFFVTEDGYLMLTVARNMAIGLGMSVSEGTIATNGVQPLATYLFSVPYLITGGDKVSSLIGILAISAALSLGGVFAIRALARAALEPQDDNPVWPWMIAALWFVSPLLLLHTMNALETGLYTLSLVVTLLQFHKVLSRGAEATPMDRFALGALCGIAFLSRNDAALLAIILFVVWGLHSMIVQRRGFMRALVDTVPPGILCLLIAAPWLISNKINFGSIVPISGSSQSLGISIGQNASLVPAKLMEYMFPMLPIPDGMEETTPVIALGTVLLVLIVGTFLIQTWRRGGAMRYVMVTYALHGLVLVMYYGLFFGAPHFMSRYMAPLAPFLIIATTSVLIGLLRGVTPGAATGLLKAVGLIGIVISLGLLGRLLIPGVKSQGHFQVVDWVHKNVPQDVWVGAVQTGTLGYWNDRTINLDGKVNPDALAVLQEHGNVLDYVIDSKIQYLADWHGIAKWTTTGNWGNTRFTETFEVLVDDEDLNLGGLKRRSPDVTN